MHQCVPESKSHHLSSAIESKHQNQQQNRQRPFYVPGVNTVEGHRQKYKCNHSPVWRLCSSRTKYVTTWVHIDTRTQPPTKIYLVIWTSFWIAKHPRLKLLCNRKTSFCGMHDMLSNPQQQPRAGMSIVATLSMRYPPPASFTTLKSTIPTYLGILSIAHDMRWRSR
jgi:hypothetical protein